MKEKYKLGTVIVERELDLSIGRKKQKVLVRIGKPKRCKDEKMDWYCPFQISGLDIEGIKVAFGIDSIQSLQLAMERIGAILQFRKSPRKLTWLDDERLGFPLPEIPEMFLKKERVWHKTLTKKSIAKKLKK
ncbi:hypothetical protein AB3N59_08115 [Leptospira sp. WS92.C1]